jgi:hypothetical protein
MIGNLFLEIETRMDVTEVLELGAGVFAVILFALSLLAYQRTGQRRLLIVSGAFGLYVVKAFFEYLTILMPSLEKSILDLILSAVEFIILMLFFLAIVKR